ATLAGVERRAAGVAPILLARAFQPARCTDPTLTVCAVDLTTPTCAGPPYHRATQRASIHAPRPPVARAFQPARCTVQRRERRCAPRPAGSAGFSARALPSVNAHQRDSLRVMLACP